MKGKYYYTFITLVLSVGIVFGSIVGMNRIWQIRENIFMSDRGVVEQENPVRSWQEWDGGENENNGNKEKESGISLITEQVKNVLVNLNDSRGEEVIHDPVKGQISMEEAIELAKNWIMEMENDKSEIQEESEPAHYSISAYLSIKKQSHQTERQLEPYYSFWTVKLSSAKMNATLYLNAVTGEVWKAEIGLYENIPDKIPLDTLKSFVELTGIKSENQMNAEISSEGNRAVIELTENLDAVMDFSIEDIDGNSIVEYNQMGVFQKHYVVILYEVVAK